MSGSGEQLVSFFLYSLFIYPVTNYIVSPQRKYPRWRAASYAIIFLLTVSTLHMVMLGTCTSLDITVFYAPRRPVSRQMYDNMENGPNHYQLLRVTRDTPISAIKKSYRNLSLGNYFLSAKNQSAVLC
jgi:hypothetical protein